MFKSKKSLIFTIVLIAILIGLSIFFTCRNRNQRGLNLTVGQPTSIIFDSVKSSVLSSDGQKILYFDLSSATFKQFDIQSKNLKNLSDKNFSDVSSIYWSPDRTQVIIRTSKQSENSNYEIKNYFFDLTNGKMKTIENNNGIDNINWASNQNKIVYTLPVTDDLDSLDIFISDPDGNNAKKVTQIKNFGAPLQFNWPSDNLIKIFKPYYNPPETDLQDKDKNAVLLSLDVGNEELTNDKIGPDIADISFSPNGNILALNKAEPNGNFEIKDIKGYHPINVAMDSSSGLTWSKDNQYLIDFVMDNSSKISIFKISLANYSVEKVLDFNTNKSSQDITFIENGIIYNEGEILFFTSGKTLYGLKTK